MFVCSLVVAFSRLTWHFRSLIGDILETTETLMKCDAIDLESLAAPRNTRIEKNVQSMGKHGRQPHKKGGTLKTTC